MRLSELDLLLRIVDGTDVAFVERGRYESARGIKLLRREPLGTYDSILALHLAQMMRPPASRPCSSAARKCTAVHRVLNDTDRDVAFTCRIDARHRPADLAGDPAQEPRRRGTATPSAR